MKTGGLEPSMGGVPCTLFFLTRQAGGLSSGARVVNSEGWNQVKVTWYISFLFAAITSYLKLDGLK